MLKLTITMFRMFNICCNSKFKQSHVHDPSMFVPEQEQDIDNKPTVKFSSITPAIHTYKLNETSNNSDDNWIDDLHHIPTATLDKLSTKFIPPINKGYVIKVYDGDTITIVSKLPYSQSPLYKFSVRLNGIDCPEIKRKTDSEIQCAQLAKTEMTNLVLGKLVHLKNVKTEKYGRLLADVYVGTEEVNVNQYMLETRLAVAYDGGTKHTPSNWLKYHFDGTK